MKKTANKTLKWLTRQDWLTRSQSEYIRDLYCKINGVKVVRLKMHEDYGRVAEGFKASVLKTDDSSNTGSVSSNLTSSSTNLG